MYTRYVDKRCEKKWFEDIRYGKTIFEILL